MLRPSSPSIAEMTNHRRAVVATMADYDVTPSQMSKALEAQGIVNPTTGKPYSRQTIRADVRAIREMGEVSGPKNVEYVNGVKTFRRPIAETIGVWTLTKPLWNARVLINTDTTFKDYIFFDALRRGMAPGYQIGGLFCMPIAQTIASHVLGAGISAELVDSALPSNGKSSLSEADGKPTQNLKNADKTSANGKPSAAANGKTYGTAAPQPALNMAPKPKIDPNANDQIAFTNAQLGLFLERNQGLIQSLQVDKYCFGNQYAIVNPDCTLSVISPETVTVEYSASDYRYPLKYIIRTKMQTARVVDEYTATKRTLTVHYYDDRGTVVREYENLIGRIPIVHFVCDRSANEIYGRPVYEAALPLMASYDDLIYNAIEGVKLLGNPIPVFEGMDNPKETKELNSTSIEYVDADGNTQTQWVTQFDRNAGLYIGKGGSAKMLNPPVGFTKDSLDMLRQQFLLLLNHTRIPEYVWGGAISSSKASAEAQMPPFIQYIKFRRLEAEGEGADPQLGIPARGGILELIDIWLRTYKLLNPTIVVGPVRIKWPEIDVKSDQIKYMWGTYLSGTGKLTDEDALALAGYWDDPAAVAARAAGKTRRPKQFDEYAAKLNKSRLQAAHDELLPPDDDGLPYSTDYLTPPDDTVDVYNITGPLFWQHMLSGY